MARLCLSVGWQNQTNLSFSTLMILFGFKTFPKGTRIFRVTVILCVVTDHPTAYLAEKIKGVNLGDETEFILRVFSPEQLEKIEDVVY